MNYLIENIQNNLNNKEKNKKLILFMIYLKRTIITNKNKKNNKIPNEYLISHLTELKQFFIDNLNGKNINLKEMIDSSNIELLNNKQLINLDEEFIRWLYHAFSSISYNFKINFTSIKNDEYIEKFVI